MKTLKSLDAKIKANNEIVKTLEEARGRAINQKNHELVRAIERATKHATRDLQKNQKERQQITTNKEVKAVVKMILKKM